MKASNTSPESNVAQALFSKRTAMKRVLKVALREHEVVQVQREGGALVGDLEPGRGEHLMRARSHQQE